MCIRHKTLMHFFNALFLKSKFFLSTQDDISIQTKNVTSYKRKSRLYITF